MRNRQVTGIVLAAGAVFPPIHDAVREIAPPLARGVSACR